VSGLDAIFDSPISGFIVALAVGLLFGAERERRRRDPTVGMAGGLRTHVVTALAGALAVQFEGVAVVVVGAIVIGALVVLAYWRDRSADPGLTSEITLFATYLAGRDRATGSRIGRGDRRRHCLAARAARESASLRAAYFE